MKKEALKLDVSHLPSVVEQNQPNRTGDVDDLLKVEEEALVPAEHQTSVQVLRTHRPQIESDQPRRSLYVVRKKT